MIYALARRGAIELVVNQTGADPSHLAQAERARVETDRWLERESLTGAPTDVERRCSRRRRGPGRPRPSPTPCGARSRSACCCGRLQHVDPLPGIGHGVRRRWRWTRPSRATAASRRSARTASLASRRSDRGRVAGGRRVVRGHRGPRRRRCGARVHRRGAVPRAQLAARSRRRTSMTTPHTASARMRQRDQVAQAHDHGARSPAGTPAATGSRRSPGSVGSRRCRSGWPARPSRGSPP